MAYFAPPVRAWPNVTVPPAVRKITVVPTEDYRRTYGANPPTPYFAPELPADADYVRRRLVPRLWKPGVSSWASPASPGWPPDASTGILESYTPHFRPRTPSRQRTGAVATLRPASAGRIAPVLVPRARFVR